MNGDLCRLVGDDIAEIVVAAELGGDGRFVGDLDWFFGAALAGKTFDNANEAGEAAILQARMEIAIQLFSGNSYAPIGTPGSVDTGFRSVKRDSVKPPGARFRPREPAERPGGRSGWDYMPERLRSAGHAAPVSPEASPMPMKVMMLAKVW